MRRSWVWTLVTVALLLVVAGATTYYWSAWRAAKSATTEIALGEPVTGLEVANSSSLGEQLGRPGPADLVVETSAFDGLQSPRLVSFTFVLSNTADQQVPPIPLNVTVKLTLHGWTVVGYGAGG